jgi:hypothetical protein
MPGISIKLKMQEFASAVSVNTVFKSSANEELANTLKMKSVSGGRRTAPVVMRCLLRKTGGDGGGTGSGNILTH